MLSEIIFDWNFFLQKLQTIPCQIDHELGAWQYIDYCIHILLEDEILSLDWIKCCLFLVLKAALQESDYHCIHITDDYLSKITILIEIYGQTYHPDL